ncbi:FAS1 domain-containing protein [Serendipita vermifera]|nr:FAS1 domain-containing protein [Serendipita vermifera]
MHLYARIFFGAVVSLSSVTAQDSNYTAGLAAALNDAGLTVLAGVLGSAPPALAEALQQGNHTVFAPSNAALASIDPSVLGNIANTLAYHVTAGVVDTSALNQSDTVVRSSLNDPSVVQLPGNQTQAIALNETPDGTVQIKNAGRNITVSGNATYENLQIWVVDSLLTIPQNLSTVIAITSELSALAAAAPAEFPTLIPALAKVHGLTLFAPVNSAVISAAQAITGADETTITNILLNHLINGTALYSSQITDGFSITSGGGEPLTFASNSTGLFVTSGNSTAKIIQTNILTSNGVIHLIDTVLLNAESDPAAASSAAASFSAQATNSPTETGPVTSSSAGFHKVDMSVPFKIIMGLFAGSILGASLL